MLRGTFTPSREAASLTKAPHFTHSFTPVTVRFSDSTGLPVIPDNDPNANPRGCAIRFQLADHVHTDIVCHSTDGFPTRTGGEFLDFLRVSRFGRYRVKGKDANYLFDELSGSAQARPDGSHESDCRQLP